MAGSILIEGGTLAAETNEATAAYAASIMDLILLALRERDGVSKGQQDSNADFDTGFPMLEQRHIAILYLLRVILLKILILCITRDGPRNPPPPGRQ